MVFSSIPAYLDPANWQQRPPPPNHQQSGGMMGLLPPPPPPPPPPQPHGSGGAGSIRPGSMTDRARMANIPMPETALKCPRCDSTNTKFCYFNNYSLSQPRHFCKTCRRYWTRGGALRSVPVGGGCRRNKRTKASSKSPAASGDRQQASCSSGSTHSISSADHVFGLGPQGGPLRFMSPLHGFSDFGGGGGGGGEIGLSNLGGLHNLPGLAGTSSDLNFHSLNVNNGSSMLALGGGGAMEQQWRPQQFPFLGEPSGMLYPFDHQGGTSFMKGAPPLGATVKVEGSHQHNNQDHHPMSLSGQLLGNNISGNDQFWSGGASAANPWTDLSGFSSSSTSHP